MSRPKIKKIAKKRFSKLKVLARSESDVFFRKECLKLASSINSKYNLKQALSSKQGFCKRCYSVFLNNKNYKVRLRKGKKVITCNFCSSVSRYPYKVK